MSRGSGLGWAAVGVLAFSLTFPATTLAERSLDPLVVGAGRSVIAAVIAAICLRAARVPVPARRHWPGLSGVALGCGIGFGALSALALHLTSSTHGAVVIGLLPAATAVVAVIRVGDRPGPVFWLAPTGCSRSVPPGWTRAAAWPGSARA
jgi:drug/metabolite transporter (DMT)-like permease